MKLHQNSGCCTAWIYKYLEILIITQQFDFFNNVANQNQLKKLFHIYFILFTIIKVTSIAIV